MPTLRRGALVALRMLVSGALLAYLIWNASPGAIWASWQRIDPLLLLVVIVLQLGGLGLSAAKWRLVLLAQGYRLPFWWLLQLYMVGQFANNFLPTTVGGDAVRAAQLGPRLGSWAHATASVLLERLTGLWALCLIAVVGLLVGVVATPTLLVLLVLGCAFATTLLLLAVGRTAPLVAAIQRVPLPQRVRHGGLRLVEALQTAASAPRAMAGVLMLSLVFQSMWVVLHLVAGAALGLWVHGSVYAVMVPLTDILGLAPIFFNNLGVREWTFSFYLGQLGVDPAAAVALAVLIFSVRLATSSMGGVILLVGGVQQARSVLQPQPPGGERLNVEG